MSDSSPVFKVKVRTKYESVFGITVITICLIALKIFKAIPFEWVWIVSPIWISVSLRILVLFVGDLVRLYKGE